MFKAEIDISILKEYLAALTAVVDEGAVRITETGLTMQAVDAANVAMVAFKLDRAVFDEFEVETVTDMDAHEIKIGEIKIGIDFVKLQGLVALADASETCKLELEGYDQKLNIKMGSLVFTISLLDPGALRKEPKVPELDYPASVTIDTEEFKRAVKAARKINDYIDIGIDADQDLFYMETRDGMDTLKLGLRRDQLVDLRSETVSSKFAADYLVAMAKGITRAEQITLYLGRNYPLQISFDVVDGKGSINYLLAPRIEGE